MPDPTDPGFTDQPPCAKPGCLGGHEPGKCTGHRSSDGVTPCRKDPVKGAQVCRNHGGKTPQVAAAAQRKAAEKRSTQLAAKAVAEWKPDMVPTDPGDVLLRATHVTWMQAAAHRHQLASAEVAGGSPFVRTDKAGREYPSALAVLEQTERRMSADMAAKAVGADLMGRHLRLMERYADSIAATCEELARRLGHDPDDPEVRRAIRQSLLKVGGEAV